MQALATAERLEAEEAPLEISATVLVLGMTGVGKSAVINSLLGRPAVESSPFDGGTKKVSMHLGP